MVFVEVSLHDKKTAPKEVFPEGGPARWFLEIVRPVDQHVRDSFHVGYEKVARTKQPAKKQQPIVWINEDPTGDLPSLVIICADVAEEEAFGLVQL